ncbi:MAG: methylated-DNA--[protein]-cysteine S-methyltransferase [Planctomycetota bacterium]|nr:methylated-DNA--[protein]-cysteine S-methyltransferase [Planctomycetales bacterium]RLT08816.1 MAG: methylated-DNA--[protein]-cysteine S-methyltransferase [Planctomycetota bacterium]
MFFTYLEDTPVGKLLVAGDKLGLRHVSFEKSHFSASVTSPGIDWQLNAQPLQEAVRQLRAYFSGKLQVFDLPLAAAGTEFQRRVWKALCRVPYGTTASYGEIAKSVGNPAAARAIGMANGRNPIAIIVPCHRIIGSSGQLVGYGGGLHHKQTLLKLEGIAQKLGNKCRL